MLQSMQFRLRALLPTALLLFSSVLAACGSPPASGPFDLTVSQIEVIQAIQTTSPLNSVPLVTERSTAVRVVVGNSGNGFVAGVTGTLHFFVDGTDIPLGVHSMPINGAISAPVAPQLGYENNTLNFEIPAPTGITASNNVRFHVDITTSTPGETNTSNNSADITLAFSDRTTPLIYYTSINFKGMGLPDASFIQSGTGDEFVRGIYPVNDSDPTLYRQGLFPSLPWDEDLNSNNLIDGTEGSDLLSFLATCRQLIVNSGVGPDDRVFLYGWVKGNPISGNGLSTIGGRVAFGNTDPTRGQRTFAHELGHLFGFSHNADTIGNVGWDVGGRLANNPASNNVAPDGRVEPSSFYDIMNPARLTNEAWIEPANYTAVFNNPTLSTSPDVRQDVARVAVIQGIFDPTGNKLLALNPVFRYPWPSLPTPPLPQGKARYIAQIVDSTGTVTHVPFDAQVDGGPKEQIIHGFFEVMVPVTGNITSLGIIDTQTGQTLLTRKQSGVLPTLVVTSPKPQGQLGEQTMITWQAGYPVPDSQVQFQIAYSPDGGRTFVPLAVNIPGKQRSVTVDTRDIPESINGQGLIRVFVSDGLNTVFADTAKLTTTAAIYAATS